VTGVFILVLTVVTSATTRFGVSLTFLEGLKQTLLGVHVCIIGILSGAWQGTFNGVELGSWQ